MQDIIRAENFSIIPLIVLGAMIAVNFWVVRRDLGVETYEEFATANRSVGFIGVALAIYTTWYVGAIYTAWAGFAVGLGFIAFYTLVYGTFGLVTMMLIGRKTFLWGKKYGCQTQADLMGLRYQSKTLKVSLGVAGILFSIPWLFMEFVTLGIAFEWASYGRVPAWVGILIGVSIVGFYIGLGGMKAAITASIFQGGFQFIAGVALMTYLIFKLWGSFGGLFGAIQTQEPALLTYPGPGATFPVPFWTSIIITSSLGNFMWPWVFNKIITADSIRSIKFAGLGAPILGAITWTLFVWLGMGSHLYQEGAADPQQAYFFIHRLGGPTVLGFFVAVVVATNISTVAAIIQAISTHITVDIAEVFDRRISDKGAIRLSRAVVVASCVVAFGMSVLLSLDKLIFWALFTYQGMVLFWPIVVLGMWWKRANAAGALVGLFGGIGLSWVLTLLKPGFLGTWGWTEGMYASAFTFIVMLIFGLAKKPEPYVDHLFDDLNPEPYPLVGEALPTGATS
ncbi:MAG: sodium:solute symporter family protein [Thermoleophilia bacterium]|nr:sodium:solute symporter family protein [Thermoleophilia bacterium]